jgi:hypothetical protein
VAWTTAAVFAGLIALFAGILFFCRRHSVRTGSAFRVEFLKACVPVQPVPATPKAEEDYTPEWMHRKPSAELAMLRQLYEQNVHLRERIGESRTAAV